LFKKFLGKNNFKFLKIIEIKFLV